MEFEEKTIYMDDDCIEDNYYQEMLTHSPPHSPEHSPEHSPGQTPIHSPIQISIKNKPRSLSVDSENLELKKPNFKCGSCKKSFYLDKNQKMIRCSFCGYRILFKLRTTNHIIYKTE